jgi:hypothetical protein
VESATAGGATANGGDSIEEAAAAAGIQTGDGQASTFSLELNDDQKDL